ncbi:MAG: DUF6677 family protein [Thermoanaerobaculia bacterium]
MAETESEPAQAPEPEGPVARANPVVCAVLAWLVPGAGHLYLRRWGRGALFLALVLVALGVGVALGGKLWHFVPGQPLSYLGTLGCAALGVPYLILRFVAGYEGELLSRGYEYGAAFILTGGLMNLLLILDAWDIARGWKE